jgi:hypothetical protein
MTGEFHGRLLLMGQGFEVLAAAWGGLDHARPPEIDATRKLHVVFEVKQSVNARVVQ